MDELLRNIEKARADALAEAKRTNAKREAADDPMERVILGIDITADLAVVRALDTILGRNTPSPLLEQD